MTKKRAMITVDSEKWDKLQAVLKERGYPANTMSVFIGSCLDHLEEYLGLAEPTNFDPMFVSEVQRKGLKATLKDRGKELVEDS